MEQLPFEVIFTPLDSTNAKTILHLLKQSHPVLVAAFQDTSTAVIHVLIAPSQAQFDLLTGHVIPEWGEAASDITRRRIVLKSPNWVTYSMKMHTIVVHELTHIILESAANGNAIPRWLNEGIAIHYSQDTNYASGSYISKALLTNSLIPLDKIDSVLKFQRNKASLAYQESYFAVKYLTERYGENILGDIIQQLSRGVQMDSIFIQTTGEDLAAFERNWTQSLSATHRWDFLQEAGNYVWIAIGILFIIAILRIHKRKQKILKQWEEEEQQLR